MSHDPPLFWITVEEAEALRKQAGLADGEGPPAGRVQAAVQVYVSQFEKWYRDQLRTILDNYIGRIVARINPVVRTAQHGQCSAEDLAKALVADWDSRNFVTAGGQALEALAIAIGPNCQKAIAEGVDIQRIEPKDPTALHLYVVKSGAVTRNTDIVSKMKTNLRKAEKLARQNPAIRHVRLNYATAVGTRGSTLADGIHRPSSGQFWSEIMEIDKTRALRLLWLMAAEAAKHISWPTLNKHKQALIAKVAAYIERPDGSGGPDWEFLLKAVTQLPKMYKEEDARRQAAATARAETILSAGGDQAVTLIPGSNGVEAQAGPPIATSLADEPDTEGPE